MGDFFVGEIEAGVDGYRFGQFDGRWPLRLGSPQGRALGCHACAREDAAEDNEQGGASNSGHRLPLTYLVSEGAHGVSDDGVQAEGHHGYGHHTPEEPG